MDWFYSHAVLCKKLEYHCLVLTARYGKYNYTYLSYIVQL